MARIQISELSSVETPMEELSYDITGNITGGNFWDLIQETFDLINRVIDICQEIGSPNPLRCAINFFNDLDAVL